MDFIYSVYLKFKNSKEYIRIYSENFSFPLLSPATIFLPFKKQYLPPVFCVTFQRDSVCYWSCLGRKSGSSHAPESPCIAIGWLLDFFFSFLCLNFHILSRHGKIFELGCPLPSLFLRLSSNGVTFKIPQ